MEAKKKTGIMIMLVLLAACSPAIFAGISRIWSRTYMNNEFTFHWDAPPEFFGFTCNTPEQYGAKTDIAMLVDGSTWIVVTEETYTNPWSEALYMDFTLIVTDLVGDPIVGAVLVATGKYGYNQLIGGEVQTFYDGGTFSISTEPETPFLLDMTKMMWANSGLPETQGWFLEVTFSIDSSGIVPNGGDPQTGDYTYNYDVIVGIGPNEGS